ncbi:MAG TPA: hypothetical protein PKE64_31345 [Anaerolineae bacterium]|nr:hypothetical protein [Anaerolineae bacterium]HMR68527.1 hypothetical protein [Anaerolineae bacterium]
MAIQEIQLDLQAIESNAALCEETNFDRRVEAIDYLEFKIIDRIEGLLSTTNQPEELTILKQSAERVKNHLEETNANLFQRFRADIRRGGCHGTALKGRINEYVGSVSRDRQHREEIGYDSLDLFINGLLLIDPVPIETRAREPEMVYYQQTPARIILELIEKADLTREDVFYDLGSGLGQVPILVHLLGGATTKGIEFEPAYCDYAGRCATDLNLSGVEFINVDARQADYTDGTVFFMYTPFEGRLLQAVLEKLWGEARRRRISLFTYGPCTPQVSRQSWLKIVEQSGTDLYKLGIFSSI